MGVDASYLYGYGTEISEIEWDLDYLKEKYKDKLDYHVNEKYSWTPTWDKFIENMQTAIKEEDYDFMLEYLEDIGHLINVNRVEGDGCWLTFNHKHIAKFYPETKLNELDGVAKLYAKELGIKNNNDIKWVEFGYFS